MKTSNIQTTHGGAIIRGWVDGAMLVDPGGGGGTIGEVQNGAGIALAAGDVVVMAIDGTVVLTTTAQDTRPVGVVLDDIEWGETGPVAWQGPVPLVNVDAAVTAAEFAETSTTAGEATSSATRREGSFGYFTSSGTAPSAFLFGGGGGSGTGGGFDLGWFVVTDYGALGDGSTDDTVAIQATIDAATAVGGGTIYFPPGHYIIAGALQDTGDFNGQILFPDVDVTTDPQVTLRFLGALHPEFAIHGPFPSTDAYSIIESTLTGGSGTAAVFSGGNGTYPVQNNVQVIVENLICLTPDDPSLTFWNTSVTQGGGGYKGVLVWLGSWANPATSPTHTAQYGVKLPQWSESNYTHVDGLMVACQYTGVLQGELAICRGLVFGLNVVALELPTSKHASLIVDMHQTGCTYGIRVTGVHACDVLQFSTEHYTNPPLPAWTVTVYDLDDSGNDMLGYIRWYALDGVSITPDHIFNINGGSGVETSEVGTPWSASASFATPAIVLGTAAAAGAATTVIRSDATIVAFDATAPTTSAIGDAAATGSAAKAARRDHVHGREALSTATPLLESGSGTVGTGVKSSREDHVHPDAGAPALARILLADGRATPFDFTDLLQADDGSDFLYSDP